MAEACLFCRIASGEIPAKLVAETDDAVAFRDIDPKAPVHVLVVPRQHLTSLATAEDEELLGQLLMLAARVARSEGVSESGYRVVANTGADGGQSVDHLHIHVLGGRKLTWPPG
ncbi:MAG TPA: histidine triad nucleotide-binding protein [Gemmatimonadaceae bacterium]|nr:histidine triad nucleotide-binding protein [Gemmatimonadaceae bacterium]